MTPDAYAIGVAYGVHGLAVVVTRGGRAKTLGPWAPRGGGVHLAILEGVERVIMLALQDVPRTIYVAQTSVVAVCLRYDPHDGWPGLRLRLVEGRFDVVHADPRARPVCLIAARRAAGSDDGRRNVAD